MLNAGCVLLSKLLAVSNPFFNYAASRSSLCPLLCSLHQPFFQTPSAGDEMQVGVLVRTAEVSSYRERFHHMSPNKRGIQACRLAPTVPKDVFSSSAG